jgi:hypothetical protein
MGDRKAKDRPHDGRSSFGRGAETRTASDDAPGEGLAARDRDIGQTRSGKKAERTGL